jgi:hypothetical protein
VLGSLVFEESLCTIEVVMKVSCFCVEVCDEITWKSRFTEWLADDLYRVRQANFLFPSDRSVQKRKLACRTLYYEPVKCCLWLQSHYLCEKLYVKQRNNDCDRVCTANEWKWGFEDLHKLYGAEFFLKKKSSLSIFIRASHSFIFWATYCQSIILHLKN